jgi:hypothetical protein
MAVHILADQSAPAVDAWLTDVVQPEHPPVNAQVNARTRIPRIKRTLFLPTLLESIVLQLPSCRITFYPLPPLSGRKSSRDTPA